MRVPQAEGRRGSQKWLQLAVNRWPEVLQPRGLPSIEWLSPLAGDEYAEYRDAAMLERLGIVRLASALAGFWPARGPQWDALGRAGDVIVLVEAKAHLGEFLGPPCKASGASAELIVRRLRELSQALGGDGRSDFSRCFYQYANRLAHLAFLRNTGVDARLLLVNFVGDAAMSGPDTSEAWRAAMDTAHYAMGLPKAHALSRFVHMIYPDVRTLG